MPTAPSGPMSPAPPRLPEDAFFTGEAEQALWDPMVERVRAGLRGTVIAAPGFVPLEVGRLPVAGFHVSRPGVVAPPDRVGDLHPVSRARNPHVVPG